MKKLFPILLLVLSAVGAHAGDIIKGTLTITNAANINSTNAYTIDVDSGSADVRTWTNAVVTPSTQILASAVNATAAQRLLIHFANYPVADVSLSQPSSTSIAWTTAEGGALTITLSTNTWGTVTYTTNTVGAAVGVRIPYTVESAGVRSDIANGLSDYINHADNTTGINAAKLLAGTVPLARLSGITTNQIASAFHDWIASLTDTDDQTAAEVVVTPAGTIAANDVQEALEELDTEKVATTRQLTIAGTANEITSSAGAQDLSANRTWTLSLPESIDLGGKTSFEVPNAAAPTVDAFGKIAGDNDLWGAGRGALLHYDGTAATAIVAALVSDTPTNGQVPKWNTGGTITWEDDSGAAGGDSVTVDGSATVDPNFDDGGDINFAYSSPNITATVKADSVALTTDTTGSYAAGDAEAGGATKITNGTSDATLATAGEMHLNTTDEQLSFHSAADGEISGEVALPLIQHRAWSFDPDAVCDGAVDRLFLMTIGDQAPEGIKIVEWKVSFEADPTTEADLDLKYADAFIGVANATVIDVLDTTAGVSTEDTNANINGGAAIVNGKVLYLEFGTAYTETGHQIIFEMWFYAEED